VTRSTTGALTAQSDATTGTSGGGTRSRPVRTSTTADSWCTPKWLADLLGPFDLDPCSNANSHIDSYARCSLDANVFPHRDNVHRDGLAFDWREARETPRIPVSVFVNPPYSNPLPWCERLRDHDGPWVALLKLDPSTRWWATLMQANPTFAPFRKRLRFEGDRAMTANFPSVLVWRRWAPSAELAEHLWLPRYA
jgi:hypothetical protein